MPRVVEIVELLDSDDDITNIVDISQCSESTEYYSSRNDQNNIISKLQIGHMVSTPYGYGQITFPDHYPPFKNSHKRSRSETSLTPCNFFKVQLSYGLASLNSSSIKKLDVGDFSDRLRCMSRMMLNDVIVNKVLADLQYRYGSNRIALFDTFTYDLLRMCVYQKDMCALAKRAKLLKLLKNIDLNTIEYILLPISGKTHWSLVVICNVNLIKTRAIAIKALKCDILKLHNLDFSNCTKQVKLARMKQILNESSYLQQIDVMSKEGCLPCIIEFDSAKLHNTQSVFSTIRKIFELIYLRDDYLTTKSEISSAVDMLDKVNCVDASVCPGFSASVPQQTNNYDCGIYMIEFCKTFLCNLPVNIDKQFVDSKGDEFFSSVDWKSIPNNIQNCRSWIKTLF